VEYLLSIRSQSFHNRELCEWLLNRGADPNSQCVLGMTPLPIAAQEASFDLFKLLFKYGRSIEHGQLLDYAVWKDVADYLQASAYQATDVRKSCHFLQAIKGLGDWYPSPRGCGTG
jgi:ankyrin repeat protein